MVTKLIKNGLFYIVVLLPLLAVAGDLYKWQDEEGNWHFSDRPPTTGTEYEVQEIPAEPKPMVSMRKTGKEREPEYLFFNHYYGPAELEIRLKVAENISADPYLPARVVLPGQSEKKVISFKASDPQQGFRYQMAYTLVPGRPLQSLPSDISFYPPFPSGEKFPISQGCQSIRCRYRDAGRYTRACGPRRHCDGHGRRLPWRGPEKTIPGSRKPNSDITR
jgi:hypothetical protein